MKKYIVTLFIAIILTLTLTGCQTEAQKVSQNLSLEYVVEDITSKEVNKYKYTLNFNPKMWIPVTIDTVD